MAACFVSFLSSNSYTLQTYIGSLLEYRLHFSTISPQKTGSYSKNKKNHSYFIWNIFLSIHRINPRKVSHQPSYYTLFIHLEQENPFANYPLPVTMSYYSRLTQKAGDAKLLKYNFTSPVNCCLSFPLDYSRITYMGNI